MNRLFILLLFVVALVLTSCGGSGGGGTVLTAPTGVATNPQISVTWGQRARQFSGPESALSVVISFDATLEGGKIIGFSEDRLTAPAAYTQTYTSPVAVPSGACVMHVKFYVESGGQGDVVAFADISAIVANSGAISRADGTPLGSIQVSSVVNSITIWESGTITSGQPFTLNVNTFGTSGSTIAVSPGSISYQITPGSGTATIDSNGRLVGGNPGTITVVATVDGVSSNPTGFTVGPPAVSYSVMPQLNSGMAMDPATGHLWASVPNADPAYGNSVIEIDPVTQTVVSSIFVGSNPQSLAFSDDGSALYVSLVGADSVAQIDPVAKKVVSQFSLPGNQSNTFAYAVSIAVEPGNPSTIALTSVNSNNTGYSGATILVNGVALPNSLNYYNGSQIAFASPSIVWVSEANYGPYGMTQGTVGASGLTATITTNQGAGYIKAFGGNVYTSEGQELNGSTGQLIGAFTGTGDFTVDVAANRAFYVSVPAYSSQGAVTLSAFATGTFRPVAQGVLLNFPTNPSGPNNALLYGMTRYGAKGLAFNDTGNIYFIPNAPGL